MTNVLPVLSTLLRERTGLDCAVLGSGALSRALRQRMEVLQIGDPHLYLERLQDAVEWQAFLDEIVVSETWFFRDQSPFTYFRRWALETLARLGPDGRLRVLSAPCATGEEPYSIAITLLEIGLLPHQFEILGVDISTRALERARRATYRKRAIRPEDYETHGRFFQPLGEHYLLSPQVASRVKFSWGNLAGPDFAANQAPFHAVFCRNLLIYFDRSARERLLEKLDRLLSADGVLFVGHAEALHTLTGRFESVSHEHAFAYRKTSHPPATVPPAVTRGLAVHEHARERRGTRQVTPRSERQARAVWAERPAAPVAQPAADLRIERAEQLADSGQLGPATAVLEALLQRERENVRAWVLLGLIRASEGNDAAADECFGKALYLDSGHEDALQHLAELRERHGDPESAERLRDRARRAEKKRKMP